MIREIVTCTSLDLGKPLYLQNELGPFLGRGILTTNGAVWAHQYKTIAHELYMAKVKADIRGLSFSHIRPLANKAAMSLVKNALSIAEDSPTAVLV
ncbi:hypothetical protein LWI28_010111 [Acer negundo]|uniref:Uncharacterized protein n=1 Tax=Acer negundo TaxID=4023 RepID=A0AAD5NU82_ACENE|nr:hypothetical protein LWI28_010111 [Acer negundo]